jgi:hypothetical protein
MAAASIVMSQSSDEEPVRKASFTELALGKKRPRQTYVSMGSYKRLETLGESAFGVVFKLGGRPPQRQERPRRGSSP